MTRSVDLSSSMSSYESFSPLSPQSPLMLIDDDVGPVIFVHDLPVPLGGGSRCYRGRLGIQEVVIKFAISRKQDLLIHESRVYEDHSFHLRHPIFYGLYESEGGLALVLEWRGEALHDFEYLEKEQR